MYGGISTAPGRHQRPERPVSVPESVPMFMPFQHLRFPCRILAVLLLGCLAAAADPPDTAPATPAADPIPVIRQEVREIRLVVTATDGHGHFVRDLGPTSFSVLDDGQNVQPFLDFRHEANLPLDVGLVVDLSGSVHSKFPFELQSVSDFLARVLRPATDRAFIAGFNTELLIAQDLTGDQRLLNDALNRLRSGGGTALFDAVVSLCRRPWPSATREPARRAILLLSDGNDNQSDATLNLAIEAAQRAEVIIYAINTSDSPTVERGDKNLQKLAEATGGRVFYPASRHDVNKALAETEEELRSQYVLSFRPAVTASDGRFHTLSLVTHVTGVKLRTRKGYFAR